MAKTTRRSAMTELTAAQFGNNTTKYFPSSDGIDVSKYSIWEFKVHADDQNLTLQVEEDADDSGTWIALDGYAIASANFVQNKWNTIMSDLPTKKIRLAYTSGAAAPTTTNVIMMVKP